MRRGWVPQPVGRGNLAPTMDTVPRIVLHLAPAERHLPFVRIADSTDLAEETENNCRRRVTQFCLSLQRSEEVGISYSIQICETRNHENDLFISSLVHWFKWTARRSVPTTINKRNGDLRSLRIIFPGARLLPIRGK